VKNRVIEYRTKTEPLAKYYEKQNKLRQIVGEGSIEEIFELLCKEIERAKSQQV
jgi:adenylate kinase